jgi:hypothetical protein
MNDIFRVYESVGEDGYPDEWHESIKHLVREEAGHRCIRCGHPYRSGENGNGEWSPCDDRCVHGGIENRNADGSLQDSSTLRFWYLDDVKGVYLTEARWRILTVHHLNGNKADCRWWNLVSLCQRCHLRVQRVVLMERVWPWEHSDWFKPYVAAYYASAYLGEEITREQAVERMDELLALERAA